MQHWVCIGPLNRLSQPGSFESGVYLDMPWVVTRAEDGQLRAFHNVSIEALLNMCQSETCHATLHPSMC